MNVFIDYYDSSKVLEDQVINGIIDVRVSVVEAGCLHPHPTYESVTSFKGAKIPEIQNNREILYVAFEDDTRQRVLGFMVLGGGNPRIISMIATDASLQRQGIGEQLIAYIQENHEELRASISSLCPDGIRALLEKCLFVNTSSGIWDWKISRERYRELGEYLMKILVEFVNTNMQPDEYFLKIELIEKENNQYSRPVELASTDEDYAHEMTHKTRWEEKYGVQATFRREKGEIISSPRAFTVPTNLEEVIKAKRLTKDQVVAMMADVCLSAKDAGFPFERVVSDLTLHGILTKAITTYPLTDDQKTELRGIYF